MGFSLYFEQRQVPETLLFAPEQLTVHITLPIAVMAKKIYTHKFNCINLKLWKVIKPPSGYKITFKK